ncbi:MAG: winged helix-turn-helix domain-containing protein [Pseudomonadota bacterium]|nr:winged helix-turn-helix domain-containing protein [Pseudomonadota bacterium]
MNVSSRVELAHEPDFVFGRLTVSPSRRELVCDDGQREVIEHRVMQVLIALSKADGSILTRDELTMSCWSGRVVGEDSIHRVMSRLRKIANGIGGGSFEIETITKIGYRLTSNGDAARPDDAPVAQEAVNAVEGLPRKGRRKLALVAVAASLLLAVGLLTWAFLGRGSLPVVAVGPADSSRQSQLLARDLFIKLGALPQLGSGRWQLVEAGPAQSGPDLLFRTAVSGSKAEPQTTLMLLDGEDRLVWSREFSFPASRESDLRQHISLTAARVLGCALEARQDGGLPPDLTRLFLNGCAALAETSAEDPEKTAGMMRAIVSQRPRFAPAWSRLLLIDSNVLRLAINESAEATEARDRLRRDIERARKIAPGLPEIKLAQLDLLPPGHYAEALDLLRNLKAQAPEKPEVWAAEANALSHVGRMREAVESARRAVELDPLSPSLSSTLISQLAWGGATDQARAELRRAERLWPGTGALRDAQFVFHLRYGNPRVALALADAGHSGLSSNAYLQARLDPSPANIDRMMRTIELRRRYPSYWASAVQALGEFNRTEDAFEWLQQTPPGVTADAAYVLFRPALANVRRDPRFMQVAKRIGLVDYWQDSGRWPDFCLEPGLPYDCRKEAARLKS